MITLRQLQIFAAVVEHGSFRRCGDMLSISQVSVSQHMNALETQLGVELFERVKGGPVRLTDAGRRAMEGVQDLLSHVHEFTDHVVGETEKRNSLTIAMHGFMMRNLGPLTGSDAEGDRCQIHLRSNESAPEILQQLVATHQVDAAYFYWAEALGSIGERVTDEPLAIFVADSHPLAQVPLVTADMLSEIPAISLALDKPIRRTVDAAMEAAGITPACHAVETAEFGLILSSLHRQIGFTCMFAAIADEEMQARGLTTLRFERPIPPLQIRRLTRRTVLRSPRFRKALAEIEDGITGNR